MPAHFAWDIYCTVDAGFQVTHTASDTTPITTCPVNAGHLVQADSVRRREDLDTGNTTGVVVVSKDGAAAPLLNQPFDTVAAALAEAALSIAADANAKVTVLVNPGVYEEAELTPPSNTAIVGTLREATTIKATNVTAATNLVVVNNPRVSLSNIQLEISTATAALNVTGIDLVSNNDTFAMKNVGVLVDTSATTSGSHHALHCTATAGTPAQIVNSDFVVQAAGAGTKRAVYLNSNGHLHLQDCSLSATGSTTNCVALETTAASSYAAVDDCTLNGATSDVKQTLGQIRLNTGCTLVNGTCGGKPLSTTFEGGWLFSAPGEVPAGTTYLYRNATPSSATVVEYPISTPTVVFGLHITCAENYNGSATFTVYRRNGATTTATTITCTLGVSALTASDAAHGESFAAGEYLSIRMDRVAYGAVDVSAQLNMF